MRFIGKLACIALFAGVLAGTSVSATASTVKVLKYKNLHSAQYITVKGAKGYMYKTATLKTKVHNIKNYPRTKFAVTKKAIVRKSSGKTVYYYVKSKKASGWLWHGYLTKVSIKKQKNIQNTIQQQNETTNQALDSVNTPATTASKSNSAKSAVDTSKSNSAKVTVDTSKSSSTKVAAVTSKSSGTQTAQTNTNNTSTVTTKTPVDTTNTDPAFNNTPTEYYLSIGSDSDKITSLYSNADVAGNPTQVRDMKTVQAYIKPTIWNEDDTQWGYSSIVEVPVKYNDQKGYIYFLDLTVIPVNTPYYRLVDNPRAPKIAGYGNITPTKVNFTNGLVNGAIWHQLSKNATHGNTITWQYNANTHAWTIIE